MINHAIYMRQALREAEEALRKDEVPVGAVIVYKGKVIARAHNQIKLLNDPTAHAEMIAVTQAANFFKNERLPNTSLYVTIEPCSMCAGAIVLARVKNLIYGADDPKAGACGSVVDVVRNSKLNHRLKVTTGVLEEECSQLIKEFFKKKRAKD